MRHSVLHAMLLLACLALPLAAQTAWPPAPFVLSTPPKGNTDIFRMDHIGGCASNGIEQDILRLQWQDARWMPPYENRNDTTDTIRYEFTFIIDSVGASSSKRILVSFPSDNDGMWPSLTLRGNIVYEALFRPTIPYPVEPDSIVMRLPWYVRAWNRAGSTYSDTAGITIRDNPIPTRPLVVSLNRPPLAPPAAIMPLHGSVITGISAQTPPIDVIWTPSSDRNIRKGEVIGAFRSYDVRIRSWVIDQARKVDTLTYQFVARVARTAPAGKGAPIGSLHVENAGSIHGIQIPPDTIDAWFGGLVNAPTPTTADTVVIDWTVYVKDFNYTYTERAKGGPLLDEVTHRYDAMKQTLTSDTAAWSRYGCRPHELVSETFRFTLVRDGITGVVRMQDKVPTAACTILSCHPAPSSGVSTMTYALARSTTVQIDVHDLRGARIATLLHRAQSAGRHEVVWEGRDDTGCMVPTGTYILRITADGAQQHRPVVVLR
jgi:hypothetical protein